MHGDVREKRQMNPLLLYISQKSRIFAAAFRDIRSAEAVDDKESIDTKKES